MITLLYTHEILTNEVKGVVSQNTTVIFEGAFYLDWRQHVSALALDHLQVLSGVPEESIQRKE
jgi:hypothetical protein